MKLGFPLPDPFPSGGLRGNFRSNSSQVQKWRSNNLQQRMPEQLEAVILEGRRREPQHKPYNLYLLTLLIHICLTILL